MLGVCPGGTQSKQGGEQAPWHLLITLPLPGSISPRGEHEPGQEDTVERGSWSLRSLE